MKNKERFENYFGKLPEVKFIKPKDKKKKRKKIAKKKPGRQ